MLIAKTSIVGLATIYYIQSKYTWLNNLSTIILIKFFSNVLYIPHHVTFFLLLIIRRPEIQWESETVKGRCAN